MFLGASLVAFGLTPPAAVLCCAAYLRRAYKGGEKRKIVQHSRCFFEEFLYPGHFFISIHKCVLLMGKIVLWASRRTTMQNHLKITSKNHYVGSIFDARV